MMQTLLDDSVAQPHFTTLLLGSFAFLGIVLTTIGIYGVVSCRLTQRTREVGIRVALGAQRKSVMRMFLRETALLLFIGIACGLAVAFGFTRLLGGLLFGIAPTDPTSYVLSALALTLAALAATYWPARRAVRVDPLSALRHE